MHIKKEKLKMDGQKGVLDVKVVNLLRVWYTGGCEKVFDKRENALIRNA